MLLIVVALVQAVVFSFVLFVPAYLMASVAPAMHQVATEQACTAAVGADSCVPLPAGAVGAELTVRMGTWNVLKSNSNTRIVTGLQALGTAGADVIGVQELQSHHRGAVARRMEQAGWEMSDGNTATPVFWRASKYTLLAQGRVKVFGVVRIEGGGAAGSSIGPKFIQWVQLQDKSTKAVFIAASHHLVPTIETKGHPNRQGPKRVAYAKRQIVAAGELATRLSRGGQIPFLIAADWNVDARKDARVRTAGFPYVALQKYDLYSNWRAAGYPKEGTQTRGTRLIDGIFSTTRTAAPVRQQILGNHGSDHRAVLVQYTNRSSSSTATLTKDTAAQVGAVPDKITVPSATGATMDLQGEQVSNAAAIIAEGKKANIPDVRLDGRDRHRLAGVRAEEPRPTVTATPRACSSSAPPPAGELSQQIRDPHLSAQAFYGVAAHTNNPGPDRHQGLADDVDRRSEPGGADLGVPQRVRQVGGGRAGDRAAARRRPVAAHHTAAVRDRPGRAAGGLPDHRIPGGEGPDPGRAARAALHQGEVPEPDRLRRQTIRPAARPSLRPGGRHHDPQLPHR